MALLLALPAQAHTPEEQRAWERGWVMEVKDNGGLSIPLLEKYIDFQQRHMVRPQASSSSATSDSAYRGMGDDVEQWRSLVAAYFPDEVNRALCIMAAESGGNPNAKNPRTGAAGLFQIMPFWWDKYGGDRYDPETNVRVASAIRVSQGWSAWSPYQRGACR